jgi:hypothetical protein
VCSNRGRADSVVVEDRAYTLAVSNQRRRPDSTVYKESLVRLPLSYRRGLRRSELTLVVAGWERQCAGGWYVILRWTWSQLERPSTYDGSSVSFKVVRYEESPCSGGINTVEHR